MPLLTEKEEASVRNSIADVASRADEAIKGASNAREAMAFVKSLHASIDKVTSVWTTGDPKPECQPGCSYCCTARVEVSDPEALRIAEHVGGLPTERQGALAAALVHQSELRAGASPYARVRCAFLEQDLCSIYEHRPASCRKGHSLSQKACQNNEPLIPQNLSVVLRCEILIAGTNQSYQSNGFPAGRNELSASVLAAILAVDGAKEWYSGKPLLQAASIAETASLGDAA